MAWEDGGTWKIARIWQLDKTRPALGCRQGPPNWNSSATSWSLIKSVFSHKGYIQNRRSSYPIYRSWGYSRSFGSILSFKGHMFSSWSGGKCEAKKTQDNTSTSYLGADCSQWPPPNPCTVEQGCNREIPEHPEDPEPLEGSWMPWSTWGGCSLSCGKGGFRTRSRHCMSRTRGADWALSLVSFYQILCFG